jgi:ribosomal protein S18 acetylase RimI-like enzyme
MSISIRQATVDDAAGISAVWEAIVAEKIYSAVDRAFTPEEERSYLGALSERESCFVADDAGRVVGFQSLDKWSAFMTSTAHVGQLGTFVLKEYRGTGVGPRLAAATFDFARSHGYEKLVIFVRGSNTGAQSFYKSLGFRESGRLARQVKIWGAYDDEILMEISL